MIKFLEELFEGVGSLLLTIVIFLAIVVAFPWSMLFLIALYEFSPHRKNNLINE